MQWCNVPVLEVCYNFPRLIVPIGFVCTWDVCCLEVIPLLDLEDLELVGLGIILLFSFRFRQTSCKGATPRSASFLFFSTADY